MPPKQRELREVVSRHVVETPATASPAVRAAAAANLGLEGARAALVAKVTRWAYKVTDEDVAAVKAEGASDDEIFELAVCAAIGEADRQLAGALAALDAATAEDRKGA
jgi:hypothetical protein